MPSETINNPAHPDDEELNTLENLDPYLLDDEELRTGLNEDAESLEDYQDADFAALEQKKNIPEKIPHKHAHDTELDIQLFRDDPKSDRHIIEGILEDKDLFLKKMTAAGYSAGAVLRRAGELGISEALIRQIRGVAADLAGERPGRRAKPSSLGARTCLSCDRVFLSSGPGNRLCMRCRGGDAGLAKL